MAWRVVILGGGFGGLYTARKLEKLLPSGSARVTLINDVNFMLYTPLLPGAAGGTLEPRHVVVPLREQLRKTDLKLARVTGADPSRKQVTITSPEGETETLTYDQLVVTIGSTSRTLPIPGELTFEVIKRRVAEIAVASDAEIVAAMRFLFERMKTVAEPSGACALAALLAGRVEAKGLRVGVTISGGNVAPERFSELVAE